MKLATIVKGLSAGLVLLVAVVALGPRARVDEGAVRAVEPEWDLDAWLSAREAAVPGIRPGDAKGIVWADTASPGHTEWVVVYLHGFSGDRHELSPTVERVAAALGANAFYTRLAGHGRDGAAMGEVEAAHWLQDAEEAMAVASRLGSRILLIGGSHGGTLAIWTAAQERWHDRLGAVVLLAPNLGPRDPRADILLWPWGGVLARLVVGPERCFEPANEEQARHWTTCYPTKALLPMMALADHVRNMDLERVTAPLLVLHHPDDQVVDPAAIRDAFPRFGSAVKVLEVVEGTMDPGRHVLAGDFLSPGSTDEVVERILGFLTR